MSDMSAVVNQLRENNKSTQMLVGATSEGNQLLSGQSSGLLASLGNLGKSIADGLGDTASNIVDAVTLSSTGDKALASQQTEKDNE